jgi:hypothetical protein
VREEIKKMAKYELTPKQSQELRERGSVQIIRNGRKIRVTPSMEESKPLQRTMQNRKTGEIIMLGQTPRPPYQIWVGERDDYLPSEIKGNKDWKEIRYKQPIKLSKTRKQPRRR